jgi:Holliday junction resolvasome RuvABC endonuclease subunit
MTSTNKIRLLAIDPFTRGFGFTVLEGSESLIDWGIKEVREDKHKRCIEEIGHLIDHYRPEVIVMENCEAKGARRIGRVKNLLWAVMKVGLERKLKVRIISKDQIRKAFEGTRNKHQIANVIAKRFPELGPSLPPVRKAWMSEDSRTAIFDAVALALTYFHSVQKRKAVPDHHIETPITYQTYAQ